MRHNRPDRVIRIDRGEERPVAGGQSSMDAAIAGLERAQGRVEVGRTARTQEFDRYTLRRGRGPMGGVDVLGWGVYPEHSVLAGQPRKVFLDSFDDEEQARAAYPQVDGFTSSYTEPQVSLSHLPGEDDPAPGGMYPDDIKG